MIVCETVGKLREMLGFDRQYRGRVGLVPTMGALHDGHVSLILKARAETEVCVVTIFVNPAQFRPGEDLAKYPRPIERDLQLCKDARVDLVFMPSVDEMYPEPSRTTVHVDGLTDRFEGEVRPGHFDGVTLVVAKLFNIVGASTAYFGRKDAQQLAVVRRMVHDLDMPVDVIECATVRDADGLALSSRNVFLTPGERERALCLPRALHAMRDAHGASAQERLKIGRELITEPLDYLEIVDPATFEPSRDMPALAIAAIRIGETRLIDNVTIEGEQQ